MFLRCRPALPALVLVTAACSSGTHTVPPAYVQSHSALAPADRTIVVGSHVVRFGGTVKSNTAAGWLRPAPANQPLLYGASYDGDFINIYPAQGNNQTPIGQLTSGLTSPQGLAVDKFGRLWAANTNAFNVVAFKRGATTPFRTLNDPGYYPVSVAVDSNGTVYAANVQGSSGQAGNVTAWAAGSTNPTKVLSYSGFQIVVGIGIDANDNVYVSYIPQSGPPALVKFGPHSKTAQPVPIQNATLSDVTFDSSGNLVMEDGSGSLGVWAPPYNGMPARTLPAFGNEPTLNRRESKVCVAYANFQNPQIECYSYTTGKLVDTITSGWTGSAIPYGDAYDPAAPL